MLAIFYQCPQSRSFEAANEEPVHILEWMRVNHDPLQIDTMCLLGALGGQRSVLKWAGANGCDWQNCMK